MKCMWLNGLYTTMCDILEHAVCTHHTMAPGADATQQHVLTVPLIQKPDKLQTQQTQAT